MSLGEAAKPGPHGRSHWLPIRYSFPSLSSQCDLVEGRGGVKGARCLRGVADP